MNHLIRKTMRKIYIIILLVGILIGSNLFGQESTTLYYLENIPQSNWLNPAMSPRSNGYLGVPAIYTNIQSDISQKFLLQSTDSGTVTLLSRYFDYDDFNKHVGKNLVLKNYTVITPISFGIRGGNAYYTFSISEKIKSNFIIPSDYFKIPEKQFPSGSSYDFSKFGINSQIYQEYAFGYSRNIIKSLRVGARFKILQGLYSCKTDFDKFSLRTSGDIWTINTKGNIYTSAPLDFYQNEDGGIDSVTLIKKYQDSNPAKVVADNLTNFSNLGIGFDLGAVYELNREWTFSASILDLGFIRWKKDLNNIYFNKSFDYVGLEIDGSNIDTIENAVDDLFDTLQYNISSVKHEKYSTGLGTTIFLGAQYNVNHYFSAGFLSRTSIDKNYFHQEFDLSANLNLYRFLTTSVNYNVAFNGEQYAGLGMAFNFFPVQFYLVLDRIPLTYTHYKVDDNSAVFAPYDTRSFNIMVGLNILFGSKGYQDHPEIDAYSEF